MSRKAKNPLPGRSTPLDSGAYNWTKSWAHGGSQMVGDANLPSGRRRRKKARARGPALFALALMAAALLTALIVHFSALFLS